MNWMYVVDIAFYACLGLLMFPLIPLALSQVRGGSYRDASTKVRAFVTEWGRVDPKSTVGRLLGVTGLGATLLVLGFVAYLANRLGDAFVPISSATFGYFGSEQVRWSVEHENEWDAVRFDFRQVSGIGSDRQRWEQAKGWMGSYDVRAARTAAVLAFVVVGSSIASLSRRGRRAKRLVSLGLAVSAVVVTHFLWVTREQQYIENLISRYADEYGKSHDGASPPIPRAYTGWWPGAEVESDRDSTSQREP
ncbi:MAG: hypothetical protein IT453_07750 [Planctomycetes bacterium]|nr:hypothetical protein [Planctomycetota bacterium]